MCLHSRLISHGALVCIHLHTGSHLHSEASDLLHTFAYLTPAPLFTYANHPEQPDRKPVASLHRRIFAKDLEHHGKKLHHIYL